MFQLTLFRMKVQKVQEVLCSGFLDVLRLSSLRSRYLSVYDKVRLLIMFHSCLFKNTVCVRVMGGGPLETLARSLLYRSGVLN